MWQVQQVITTVDLRPPSIADYAFMNYFYHLKNQVTKEGDGEEMMPPEEEEGEEGGDGENCDEEVEQEGGSDLGGGSMKVRTFQQTD